MLPLGIFGKFFARLCISRVFGHAFRRRVMREVQTLNWEAGKEGAVETGVERGLKKAHKL